MTIKKTKIENIKMNERKNSALSKIYIKLTQIV